MKLISVFTLSVLFIGSLLANDSVDSKVLDFEKNRFSKNKRVEIKDISVNLKKQMPQAGWFGYIIDLDVDFAGKNVKAKDVVFSNGELIAPELFDIKTGLALKDLMTPKLTKEYYKDKNLIAGNSNAKDKIVVFSDPLCPFCMDYVPDVINYVKKHDKSIALYYYHFPLLRIHPASNALTKLMALGKTKNIEDIELKVYNIDWDKYFNSRETNAEKILKAFNSEFKTNFSLDDLNSKEITNEVAEDIKMGEEVLVQGTPTIFINGEQDKSKLKYEKLGK
ncbi:thioredoxin domain-containing protein [Halarcobacter sp.]|uniref:DsbA family protein n=1 Tax=Halarcobacter sp. TaxID=2321133 RepID=UPI002AA8F46C|nr:thioredoxin domain-containing protein [Halarcobacter sp.]